MPSHSIVMASRWHRDGKRMLCPFSRCKKNVIEIGEKCYVLGKNAIGNEEKCCVFKKKAIGIEKKCCVLKYDVIKMLPQLSYYWKNMQFLLKIKLEIY